MATLVDYRTGETIREATAEELRASVEAAERDGGAGVILVDGRRCYVEGEEPGRRDREMTKFFWTASWGAENDTSGEAETVDGARDAARACYGGQGATVRVYDESGAVVLRETRGLDYKSGALVWRED